MFTIIIVHFLVYVISITGVKKCRESTNFNIFKNPDFLQVLYYYITGYGLQHEIVQLGPLSSV